jgi:hypothetical protein
MAKKTDSFLPTWALFILGVGLLVTMWLVSSFPIAAFFAFAPLLMISARAGSRKEWEWGSYDLIWVALSAGYFAAMDFNTGRIFESLLLAVMFMIPFLLGGWIQRSTSLFMGWTGTVVLWTSSEFAVNSLGAFGGHSLATVFGNTPGWVRWSHDLGTLSMGTWVLLVNLAWAAAIQGGRFGTAWIIAGVILIALPIGLSLLLYEDVGSDITGYEPMAICCSVLSVLMLAITYFRAR